MRYYGPLYPFYNDDNDYNTNAPSYYDYLARLNKLLKIINDQVDLLKQREITFTDSDSITTKRIETWEGLSSKLTTFISELEISDNTNTLTLDNVAPYNFNLSNATTVLNDGVFTPDYENVLKAIDGIVGDFKASDGRNTFRPVPTPDQFSWKDHPLQNKIFSDNNGNFKVNFDVEKLRPFGKRYHVDVVNGNDSNNGLSQQTALKTMTAAYNKPDIVEMVLYSGIYYRNDTLQGIDITKDLSIIGAYGEKPLITSATKMILTPNTSYSNVYQMETSGVTGLFDLKNRNENQDYYILKQVDSISEVSLTPGSYYHDGSVLYLSTVDGRVPDDDIIRLSGGLPIKQMGNSTLYLENLEILAGNSALDVEAIDGQRAPRVYGKNCKFKFSATDGWNCVYIKGAELSIMQNCDFSYSKKDGINYARQGEHSVQAVEIDCSGTNNGTYGASNDQVTTVHNDCRIIRINGTYEKSYGNNIGDSGSTTYVCESWNLGCVNGFTQAVNPPQAVNFMCYENTKMFIDGCVGHNATYDISGQGQIFVHNNNLLSESPAWEGSVLTTYTY